MGLEKHKIAEAIEKDFNKILKSDELQAFEKSLEFKSPRSAQVDKDLFNMLLGRLKMYKNGWIQANSLSTVNLSAKDKNYKQLFKEFRELSTHLNEIIKVAIKHGLVSEEKLTELRSIETELIKLDNKI